MNDRGHVDDSQKDVSINDTSVGDISLVGVMAEKIWMLLSRVHLVRVPLFGMFPWIVVQARTMFCSP